ncbi:MAG TPA: hypothetical protein VNA19_05540 [Pyrinomonadaceae bacterium]|jgi:hypothetical protein|nr:hypothetical protein [Pyrinomonadaceae bacterium]
MRQRLLFASLICTLLLHGWGGALAAACCAHDGAAQVVESATQMDEGHACCRRQQSGGEAADCPMSKARAGEADAPHREHRTASTEATDDASRQAHHDASERANNDASQHTDAASSAPDESAFTSDEHAEIVRQTSPHIYCAHCMGRRERQPAPTLLAPARDGAKRSVDVVLLREACPPALPSVLTSQKIIPAQESPPARTPRYVLYSNLLI